MTIEKKRQREVWESDVVQRALKYAADAHSEINQKRKYTGEDYIVHPIAVAKITLNYVDDENAIAAALLHDVVEDTKRTLKDIENEFGSVIASYVEMLTDVSTLSDGNRAQRKAIDREHTKKAIPKIKTVKLADIFHNTNSIVKHGGGFAYKWMSEKVLLMNDLKEGDKDLYRKTVYLSNKFYGRNIR